MRIPNKEQFYNLKINRAVLYKINLVNNVPFEIASSLLKAKALVLLPFVNTTKLAHYALLLELENDHKIIIEYGQYLNEFSDEINPSFFSSIINSSSNSDSSNSNPGAGYNNNTYYYLLKDGARFYEMDKEQLRNYSALEIIRANYFGITLQESRNLKPASNPYLLDNIILNVGNQITLGELIQPFLQESWNAKDYNILTHNCQDFVCRCIRILMLTRIDSKSRMSETMFLSPCIVSAFYETEGWNSENTVRRIVSRIPIVGMLVNTSA